VGCAHLSSNNGALTSLGAAKCMYICRANGHNTLSGQTCDALRKQRDHRHLG